MKRLLSIFIVLAVLTGARLCMPPDPVDAQMLVGMFNQAKAAAPSFVQSCAVNVGVVSPSSISCTFGSSVIAGHLLEMCLSNGTGGSSIGTITWSGDTGTVVTDLANTTWNSGISSSTCAHILVAGGGNLGYTLDRGGQQLVRIHLLRH